MCIFLYAACFSAMAATAVALHPPTVEANKLRVVSHRHKGKHWSKARGLFWSSHISPSHTSNRTSNKKSSKRSPPCSVVEKQRLHNSSTVLRANPAGVRSYVRETVLRNDLGAQCLYSKTKKRNFVHLVIDEDAVPYAFCCNSTERHGMGTDADGNLLPFAEEAFANMEVDEVFGVTYAQIAPDACPAPGCPLVVEISGNAGRAWLMVRDSCEKCHERLGVVMISPLSGPHENTSMEWVSEVFNPFIRAYVSKKSGFVDAHRVYMVTASRGNEIGLTSALMAPDLWSFVLMSGKFKFTPEMWSLLEGPDVFHKARKAGLRKLSFHIGDVDNIEPDDDFYANFTSMLDLISKSDKKATVTSIHVYPDRGHDVSPLAWNKLSPTIWSATSTP